VAVPARNEEATVAACVVSIAQAARRVDLPVDIIVVCDSCTDATPARAMQAGARILTLDKRNVGAARAAGIADLLSASGPTGLWLATTDADSVVPRDWLERMLEAGRSGYAAVAGTVRVEDWRQHPPKLIAAYHRHYARGIGSEGHGHVHGANLGFSAVAYERIGGLPPLALAEDHALIDAFVDSGRSVARLTDLIVTTSARLDGRASGGFADFLRSLVREDSLATDTSPA
jgi:glycosyltransferase involved in cell wall biosynthesis